MKIDKDLYRSEYIKEYLKHIGATLLSSNNNGNFHTDTYRYNDVVITVLNSGKISMVLYDDKDFRDGFKLFIRSKNIDDILKL